MSTSGKGIDSRMSLTVLEPIKAYIECYYSMGAPPPSFRSSCAISSIAMAFDDTVPHDADQRRDRADMALEADKGAIKQISA